MSALSCKTLASPVCSGRSLRSVSLRAPAPRRCIRAVVVRSYESGGSGGEELAEKLKTYASETGTAIKDIWEDTADAEKPAAIAILVAVVVAQVALAGTLDSVERLPLIKQFFEFVGIAVSVVYGYRYFTVKSERESWKAKVDSFVSQVTGK